MKAVIVRRQRRREAPVRTKASAVRLQVGEQRR